MNIVHVQSIVRGYLPEAKVVSLSFWSDGYLIKFGDNSKIKFTTEDNLRDQLLLKKKGL